MFGRNLCKISKQIYTKCTLSVNICLILRFSDIAQYKKKTLVTMEKMCDCGFRVSEYQIYISSKSILFA